MILFLRNNKGENLLDLNVWIKSDSEGINEYKYIELNSSIHIPSYSKLLLNNAKKQAKIIEDFDNLSELRGWLWERHFMVGRNEGTQEQLTEVIGKLRKTLKKVAKDYKLELIED